MRSLDEALAHILADVKAIGEVETIDLFDAHRRVLAEDQVARVNVPPADSSAMDGYAIRFDDRELLRVGLPISQRIPAGHAPGPLVAKTAARIFTGGVIPPGADTIVIQENCRLVNGALVSDEPVQPKAHIRRAGQDIEQGQTVFKQGEQLRAQDLGLLASVGIAELKVLRKLKVGILATGDELLEPGAASKPGSIYNSNRFTLRGLLNSLGIETLDLGCVKDKLDLTIEKLQLGAAKCDALISTGGVSVGEEDHVKSAVEALGSLSMWKLAIKPGKPFAYGRVQDVPFFGLPGNPVAVFVTFLMLVRPYLLRMQQVADIGIESYKLPANFSQSTSNSRREFIRVRIADNRIERYPSQDSGILSSTHWANALAIIPEHHTFNEGDLLEVIPLSQFSL